MLKYSTFFVVILFATPLFAQFEFYTLKPNLIKGANAVVREERQTFQVQSIGKATEQYYISTTILNEAGNDHAQLVLPYSNLQKVKSVRATLFDKFGKEIRKIKEKDFQDLSGSTGSFFDDIRLKAIDLSYTDYPYTVEFAYEMQHDGLLFYPVWRPQPTSLLAVQKSTFEISLPAQLDLRYKSIHFDKEPTIATNGDKRYTWEATSLPAYSREPYTPVDYTYGPTVYTAPRAFEIEGYTGEMSSWESFGQFFAKLNEGKRELPEATVQKLQAMTADCTDDLCKIQKLYTYLQENTRYVSIQLGIGSWQPIPAADVDAYKYGDCKALSNYYCAMLEAVGVPAFYTLIRAGNNYHYLQRDFASSQFNHVVVCIPQGRDTIWAECTSQTAPLGYAGSFTGNREALIITPEGGKLVKTPIYYATDNFQGRTTHLTMDVTGNAEATINTFYGGLQQEYASYLAEMPEQKRKEELYAAIHVKNFEILEHRYKQEKKKLPRVDETLKLRLPNFAGKSGKRLFVNPTVLDLWNRIPPQDSLRERDIQLTPHPFVDHELVILTIPSGYGVEYLPETVEIDAPFGKFQCVYKQQDDGSISYSRQLELNATVHTKEMYAELIAFCKQINKADARRMVLVQQ